MRIAVIGTAGRDKSIPMTRNLWDWMLDDARERIDGDAHLVSGGAAWADHIAVALFLESHVPKLTLHLPAPLQGRFIGSPKSAGSAANYYHDRFSEVVGFNSLEQIVEACTWGGCDGTFEPQAEGYGAMFSRNAKVVASSEGMLAYTFGVGDEPADGGTRNTWDQFNGEKIHVSLPRGLRELKAEDKPQAVLEQEVKWDTRNGYECSSKGDKRFSALYAVMPDGRTVEQHYQCDVKGYQPGGRDWQLGKGKPPKDLTKHLWTEYLSLWQTWAQENPELIRQLAHKAKEFDYVLSDTFAKRHEDSVNQARALAQILNEGNHHG